MSAVVALLSDAPKSYGSRRLGEEAAALGLEARVLEPRHLDVVVGAEGAGLRYRGHRLEAPAAILARTGSSTDFGRTVLRQLEATEGVAVVNTAAAVARSRDKMATHQLLAQAGVPSPRTVLVRRSSDLDEAVREVGGLPVVLKLLRGTRGKGVMRCSTLDDAQSAAETVWALGEDVLVQEYVADSAGRDLRVLVVGGRALGCVERTAEPGRFRANVHGGAGAVQRALDERLEAKAVAAAEAVGLEVAGVDLVACESYLVIEVNAAPGFEGFERATGINAAAEIMGHVASLIGG